MKWIARDDRHGRRPPRKRGC